MVEPVETVDDDEVLESRNSVTPLPITQSPLFCTVYTNLPCLPLLSSFLVVMVPTVTTRKTIREIIL